MSTATAPASLSFLLRREIPPAGGAAAPASASAAVEAPPATRPATRRADEIEISGGE